MGQIRKRHSATFKAKVALEATKQDKPISELAKPHRIHPVQISQWKKQLLECLFENGSAARRHAHEKLQAELFEQSGRLQSELPWVKKNLRCEAELERAFVESTYPQLIGRRQCELLGLNRSSFSYEPATETIENLILMRRIDQQHRKTPFYGSRRMAAWLTGQGEEVNRKRVRRLMGVMGLDLKRKGSR